MEQIVNCSLSFSPYFVTLFMLSLELVMTPEPNLSFSVTKAGHALHTSFLRHLLGEITVDPEENLAGQC
uniref:Uncharacterized protein n=1 Tax=Arundo donax TaxID=35708 RepID=A0A0A9DII1_ARUDO